MGLDSLGTILTDDALTAVRSGVEAAMTATVTVYDPQILGVSYNTETGAATASGQSTLYTGAARVIVRGRNMVDGNPTQTARIITRLTGWSSDPRAGLVVEVTSAPQNTALQSLVFTVVGLSDISSALAHVLECVVGHAYEAN